MKTILIILFLGVSTLYATPFLSLKDSVNKNANGIQTLQWTKNYSRALTLAKEENKPLMYLVSKDGCSWCDRFKSGTLSYDMIVRKLNENFIVIEGYTNRGEVPRHLLTSGTPATWFLTNDGEPMFQPIMGAIPAQRFDSNLNSVLKEYQMITTLQHGKIATH